MIGRRTETEAGRKLEKKCVCVCVSLGYEDTVGVREGVIAWLTDWPIEAGRDERKVRRCQAKLKSTHTNTHSPSYPCD